MQNTEQLDIDFFAPAEDGYEIWQWERKEAEQRIAKEWKLPIGKMVCLKRLNIDGEFEGKLGLAKLPLSINKKQPLEVKIGKMKFTSDEIEKCSVIYNNSQH